MGPQRASPPPPLTTERAAGGGKAAGGASRDERRPLRFGAEKLGEALILYFTLRTLHPTHAIHPTHSTTPPCIRPGVLYMGVGRLLA